MLRKYTEDLQYILAVRIWTLFKVRTVLVNKPQSYSEGYTLLPLEAQSLIWEGKPVPVSH